MDRKNLLAISALVVIVLVGGVLFLGDGNGLMGSFAGRNADFSKPERIATWGERNAMRATQPDQDAQFAIDAAELSGASTEFKAGTEVLFEYSPGESLFFHGKIVEYISKYSANSGAYLVDFFNLKKNTQDSTLVLAKNVINFGAPIKKVTANQPVIVKCAGKPVDTFYYYQKTKGGDFYLDSDGDTVITYGSLTCNVSLKDGDVWDASSLYVD